MVLGLRGADEAVERHVEPLVHLLEPAGIARGEFGDAKPLALGGLHHLQAVLVGAGQEEHVLAVEPLKPRQRVGRDRLVGVADMRNAVRIGDRGGDEVGVALGSHRRLGRGSRLRARRGWLCTFSYGGCLYGGVRFLRRYRARLRRFVRGFLRRFLGRFLQAWLLSSQPFWVTSARLSLQPSSKPCRPSSRCACVLVAPFLAARFFPRPSCRRGRAAICGPSSPCAFSKLSFQPSPPRIPFQLNDIRDYCQAERYRVASASIPNTEKTSGFRSRL